MSELAGEVKAARGAAAVVDRSARGKLRVRGNDRLSFLHNMLSNSITTLAPGKGCRAELLDERGHIVGDLRVYAGADDVLIDLEPGMAAKVGATLEKYIIMDDAQIEDATAALASFTVCGPKAPDVLRAILGAEPPRALYDHLTAPLSGIEARVARSRWTGSSDFDVWVPIAQGPAVRAMLEAGVLAAGGATVGLEAFEVMRIEAGIARQGAELDDVVALETRLDAEGAISFTKGCYLGQEVMARIDSRGHVNRLLVGLILDATEAAAPVTGASIQADGKEIGRVTSAALSPSLGKPIALGYVRREHSDPGKILTIGGVSAVVTALPFVAG